MNKAQEMLEPAQRSAKAAKQIESLIEESRMSAAAAALSAVTEKR